MTNWNPRLDRLEARYGTELPRIGPTDAERELARELRANPRTRKFIAYVVDPLNPTPEELAGLTEADRALLRRALRAGEED